MAKWVRKSDETEVLGTDKLGLNKSMRLLDTDLGQKLLAQESISEYMMFNPYQHLSKTSRLTTEEWNRVKARLTQADLDNLDYGATIVVGSCVRVWKRRE